MHTDYQGLIDELQRSVSQIQAILDVVSMSQALQGQSEAIVLGVARDHSEHVLEMVRRVSHCPLIQRVQPMRRP
jgi:hypothetical protein